MTNWGRFGWPAALIVGSAVAFDPAGWVPFTPVKGAVVLVLGPATIAAAAGSEPIHLHRRSTFGWGAFLTIAALASLFALDPLSAWIGTPDRHLGFLTWLLMGGLFLAGQQLDDPRPPAKAAVVAGLVIGAYTAAESLGSAPVHLAPDTDRLGGPFGSPAYLSAAAVLLGPAALAIALDRRLAAGWRLAGAGSAVALAGSLVGSQTRAAVVGVVAAVVVTFPAWGGAYRRRRAAMVVAGLAAVALVAVTPLGARLASVLDAADPGGGGRVAEWSVAERAVVDHPLLGVGFEGYRIVFGRYVDAGYVRRFGREVITDRAHSGILDLALTTGLAGATLYVVAVVWLTGRAWQAARGGEAVVVGLAGGVVGYLVQQQFLFPLAELDPVMWLMAGVLVAATGPADATPVVPRWIRPGLAILAVLAAVVAAGPLVANRRAQQALEASAAGDHRQATALADQAAEGEPWSFRMRLLSSEVHRRLPGGVGLEAALDRVEQALALSPRDPALLEAEARLLSDRAAASGAGLSEAVAAWRHLVEIDPNHPQRRLEYGLALVAAGDEAAAEKQWLAAADLAPASPVPLTNLAALWLGQGRTADARRAALRAAGIDPSYPPLVEVLRLLGEEP